MFNPKVCHTSESIHHHLPLIVSSKYREILAPSCYFHFWHAAFLLSSGLLQWYESRCLWYWIRSPSAYSQKCTLKHNSTSDSILFKIYSHFTDCRSQSLYKCFIEPHGMISPMSLWTSILLGPSDSHSVSSSVASCLLQNMATDTVCPVSSWCLWSDTIFCMTISMVILLKYSNPLCSIDTYYAWLLP